jgi:hypothetical protein
MTYDHCIVVTIYPSIRRLIKSASINNHKSFVAQVGTLLSQLVVIHEIEDPPVRAEEPEVPIERMIRPASRFARFPSTYEAKTAQSDIVYE